MSQESTSNQNVNALKVVLQALSALIAIIAAVFVYSDQIQALAVIDPQLAQYWPLIALGGTILSRIAAIIGDIIDDGKLNGSFGRAVSIALLLAYLAALVTLGASVTACTTQSGNAAADRRGRITNAVLAEAFNAVVKAGLNQGARALAGQNGQDAYMALFDSGSSIDAGRVVEHILKAAAGPEIEPVALVASAQVDRINPSTYSDRRLVANTLGAAVQYAANQLAVK